MAQLTKRLGLDLSDSLSRDRELTTYFFKRVVSIHIDSESHSQHFGFSLGEPRKNVFGVSAESLKRS